VAFSYRFGFSLLLAATRFLAASTGFLAAAAFAALGGAARLAAVVAANSAQPTLQVQDAAAAAFSGLLAGAVAALLAASVAGFLAAAGVGFLAAACFLTTSGLLAAPSAHHRVQQTRLGDPGHQHYTGRQ